VGASERDEFLRAVWRAMGAETTQAERFVFVDECSTNVSLRPLYAWSPRGERAHCSAPRNWGKNVTLLCMLCSMTLSAMGPSLAVEGATTRAVFEAYVEEALVPSLHPEQVVVMDNLLRPTRERG
jgi:DDE superfamily endonuclease